MSKYSNEFKLEVINYYKKDLIYSNINSNFFYFNSYEKKKF